jgi:hypothetical protein
VPTIFGNSGAIRSIFSTCNALDQGGLPTLPDVCYRSGNQRRF